MQIVVLTVGRSSSASLLESGGWNRAARVVGVVVVEDVGDLVFD